jgi:hypothetical protein
MNVARWLVLFATSLAVAAGLLGVESAGGGAHNGNAMCVPARLMVAG